MQFLQLRSEKFTTSTGFELVEVLNFSGFTTQIIAKIAFLTARIIVHLIMFNVIFINVPHLELQKSKYKNMANQMQRLVPLLHQSAYLKQNPVDQFRKM